ncbi:phosphonate C-P lyase system protein PhnH [Roseibium litorale]|uniref:Phosphonate C-P lyase system protein PhnH n=1 Tax=Roseibium litorale TaxID=2803841 RepID=A0ABR9CSM2_9HYPH|nr:phosphonate C-P lyase system protein PhnH [Roseibium litorale]MBD8893604.1 phosphonate C-P lyase system protein PhnH [Roseibium litorale]
MSSLSYSGGFAEPVFAAQAAFRAVLDAFARPGNVISKPAETRPPEPFLGVTGDLLCTLADTDTPVFLAPLADEDSAAAAWLRFHTGAEVTRDASRAVFAVCTSLKALPALSQFPQGTAEYPDRSTTLILQVESLEGGETQVLLSGPGLAQERPFAPKGLAEPFWHEVARNNGQYPRGVDFLFVSASAIAGVPRSTKIQLQGA